MSSPDMQITVLKEIQHPLYVERIENWKFDMQKPSEPATRMNSAYNLNGDYIGDVETAKHICDKYGIAPEISQPGNSVCSIGYSEKHGKWFGWSHRAICGFGIGDKIFEEKYGDDETPYVEHGSKPITTLDDAKLAAQRFAESVASTAK